MTIIAVAALATSLLAAHFLGNAGFALFPAAAALCLAGARRQARARARADAQEQTWARDVRETPALAPEQVRGRAGVWARCVMLAGVGLAALVWALGVWVLWALAGAAGLGTAIWIYFRGTRRRVAEVSVTGLSTPLDRDAWMSELPGRVADAVDAARLIRGHADPAGVHAPHAGEGAA